PLGKIERRGTADIMLEVRVHLGLERRVCFGRIVCALQLEDERHQRLGDEAAAKDAEMPALVGSGTERIGLRRAHAVLAKPRPPASVASRAARMKARMRSGSFSPGVRSTPEETSTPAGRAIRNASATLVGSRPPESRNGAFAANPSSRCQSNAAPR